MEIILLSIKSITGNSQLAGFKDKIVIESYSHNISLPMNLDVGNSERTLGRPAFSPMNLSKMSDIATPQLYAACAGGTKLGDVVLDIGRNESGKFMPLIKYTLGNAMISSVQTSGHAGGAVDSFTLHFTSIATVLTQQKTDASAKGNAQFGWNIAENIAA